jgi:hypothetical protein
MKKKGLVQNFRINPKIFGGEWKGGRGTDI